MFPFFLLFHFVHQSRVKVRCPAPERWCRVMSVEGIGGEMVQMVEMVEMV